MSGTISIPPKPRSLVVFFTLAFALSWAVWVPATLASYHIVSFQIDSTSSGLLGVFGPFIAALMTTLIYDGRAGFRTLFKRLLVWRVGIQWYLFVLFWPAALSLAKTAVAVLSGSAVPDFSQPPFVRLYPLPSELLSSTPLLVFLPAVFVQQTLIGSSMGEVLGWRGYALPRLQSARSSMRASLLLGALWDVWHVPLWLARGHPMQAIFLGWPVLALMATTILFTWVYNNTRGSLVLMLLFHTSIATTELFLSAADAHPLVSVILTWAMAGLVIAGSGHKDLSHGAAGA